MKEISIAVISLFLAIGCSRTGPTTRRDVQQYDLASAGDHACLVLFNIKTHQPHLYDQMKGRWVKFGYLAELNKERYGIDFSEIRDFRYLVDIEVLVGSDPIMVRAVDCDDPAKYRYFD